MNVSVRTVEAWETGRRTPNHAALRLLEIEGYEAIKKALEQGELRVMRFVVQKNDS